MMSSNKHHFISIKLYRRISSISCTCVLFTLLIQLVNGAQCLNINFFLVLFIGAAAAALFGTVDLDCIYASL